MSSKSSTSALHEKLHVEKGNSEEELQQKLIEAEEKAAEALDRMLRVQADTENRLRRSERDISNAHKFALEKFVLELLPIIDNLERSVSLPAEGAEAVLEGINMTLKILYASLEKFGIQQVNPETQAFNPELHQAVSMQPDATVPPNTVLNVLQKGYLLNGRLVRPAMVVVSK